MNKYTLSSCILLFGIFCTPVSSWSDTPASAAPDVPLVMPGGNDRLYWNTIQSPRALEMRGATWKDPALVPPLQNSSPQTTRKTPKKAQARPAAPAKHAPAHPQASQEPGSAHIPPLKAPDPHDEDRSPRQIQPFDPFAKSEPVPPVRLQ